MAEGQSSPDNSERDIVAKVQKARHFVPGHLIGHRVEVGVIAKFVRSSYKGAPAGARALPAVDPHSGGQDADPAPPRRARGSLPRLVRPHPGVLRETFSELEALSIAVVERDRQARSCDPSVAIDLRGGPRALDDGPEIRPEGPVRPAERRPI